MLGLFQINYTEEELKRAVKIATMSHISISSDSQNLSRSKPKRCKPFGLVPSAYICMYIYIYIYTVHMHVYICCDQRMKGLGISLVGL